MFKEIIKHTIRSDMAIIVLGYPYQPYTDCGLDAYYLATQEMYKECKQIQNQLQSAGAHARIVNDVSLRDLSFKSGLATILGVNQMAMRPDCGSWLVLAAIETDFLDTVQQAKTHLVDKVDKCIDCGECVRCCPTGAIGINGEFYAEKCLRSYQCGDVMPIQIAELMGKRFLGCDICQVVCPHNFHIEPISPPQFVTQALKNCVYTIAPFKDIIGTNYARAKYLTVNSIVYSANALNRDAIQGIKELAKDEKYSEMAQWALKKLQ